MHLPIGSSNPPSVTVRVGKPDFSGAPWLVLDVLAEFVGNFVHVINVEINKCVGLGVTFVFG